MREIKASTLAKTLGISRRTVSDWCKRDHKLAFRRGRHYYIRIAVLAKRPGMDIVSALMVTSDEWIKACDFARLSGIPRRTVAHWCATLPFFARRIGRNWYLSLEMLGVSPDQAAFLRKWAPNRGEQSQLQHQEESDE